MPLVAVAWTPGAVGPPHVLLRIPLVMLGVFWCVMVPPGVVLVCFGKFLRWFGGIWTLAPLVAVAWTPGAVGRRGLDTALPARSK